MKNKMVIYWDTQDANNIGPAYRENGDSGELEFVKWSDGGEYQLDHFFSGDGEYLGANQNGVYPIFRK